MKPVPFDYARPADVPAALKLAGTGGAVKIIAGGQSLGPMLNLRLVQPELLIDITAIAELKRVEEKRDSLVIGSCITHADIEDGRIPDVTNGALRTVAAGIAYRAVRNRGTIGGSLCHADPAADWVSTLCAFEAQCIVFSERGRRRIAADQFVLGAYENALEPGEILEAIEIPRLSARGRWGYYKVCRKAGEFASALGAVIDDEASGRLRAVIGATHGRPIVVADARTLLRQDATLDENAVLALLDRHNVSDPAARHQQVAALSRAYQQAKQA